MPKTLQITLVKSPIGFNKRQKATVKALGLSKLHQTVEQADNSAVRGMINAVSHLVVVKEHPINLDQNLEEFIMRLEDLRPAEGSTKKRKRVGRGTGSGKGKTSTRGTKGQNSRTGGGVMAVFEGGQLRLVKRLPKLRGFNNRFKIDYSPINLDTMARVFDSGATIDPAALSAVGLLGKASDPVVVLARGDINKAIHVKAHRVSEAARKKIEAAGGSIEILPIEVNRRMPRS